MPALPDLPEEMERVLAEAAAAAREQAQAAWELQLARVQEQMRSGWREQLDQIFAERFQEAGAALLPLLQTRTEALQMQVRREWMERLNQSVRRMRQAERREEFAAALLELAGECCGRAALFETSTKSMRRILTSEGTEPLEVSLVDAPAVASAVEGRDPVVALRSAGELSAGLLRLFPDSTSPRAYLFPLVGRERTLALLYAEIADGQPVDVNGLELLASIGAGALELRAAKPTSLVALAGSAPKPSWQSLTREERDLHLRAQNWARTQVAKLILHRMEAVKRGRIAQNIYPELQQEIDADRREFRERFMQAQSSMVDYYHLELVQVLAHDHAAWLGSDYPGPMV